MPRQAAPGRLRPTQHRSGAPGVDDAAPGAAAGRRRAHPLPAHRRLLPVPVLHARAPRPPPTLSRCCCYRCWLLWLQYGAGPYSTKIKALEGDVKDIAKRVGEASGVKESDTGLAHPSRWDLVSDKQAQQEGGGGGGGGGGGCWAVNATRAQQLICRTHAQLAAVLFPVLEERVYPRAGSWITSTKPPHDLVAAAAVSPPLLCRRRRPAAGRALHQDHFAQH